MRVAAIIASLVTLSACERTESTPFDAAPGYAGTTFAALGAETGDKATLWLSSATRDRLGLCLVAAATDRCDKSTAGYLQATQVFQKPGGQRILAFNEQVPARTDKTYVVVADDGTVELRFLLKDLAASVDPLADGIAGMQKETLRSELTLITREEYNGRLSATPENEKVADWLIDHLKRLGIEPGAPEYRQRFRLGVGPTGNSETANIVGKIEGSDPQLKNEWIVIGAHMDHAGTLTRGYTCSQGSGSSRICTGADDNGSGTISVLNVAKALAGAKGKMKRSVLIMWFSGEEEGLIGSKYYVAHPLVPLDKTVYMVNLDMVGYAKSFGNAIAALGGGSLSAGKQVLEDVSRKYPGTPLKISASAGGGSDHAPFFNKGIPGVFFHTGVSNNPNYHKTSDHVDKIDFDGMLVAAKVAFETVYRMANAPSVGTYDDGPREPLVSDEELTQTCHHLIQNPFLKELEAGLDFTNGNDGRP